MHKELKFTREMKAFSQVEKVGFVNDDSFRYSQKGVFKVERTLVLNAVTISNTGDSGILTYKSKSFPFSLKKKKLSNWVFTMTNLGCPTQMVIQTR